MLIKYSPGFETSSLSYLVVWALLIPQFFCEPTICPPPDFPLRGRYKPEKDEYEVRQSITYFCIGKLPMHDERNVWNPSNIAMTCEPNGKWSQRTPICDVPTRLKYSIIDSKESIAIDGKLSTCFQIGNDTEEILQFSFDGEAVPYSMVFCFGEGRGMFNISFPPNNQYFTYTAHIGNSRCIKYDTTDVFHSKSENISVKVSPSTNSFNSMCGFEVFAKNDKWCDYSPEKSTLNGQLEVGRSKTVLHCNENFREKESREIYATCENNKWSYQGLECVESKPQKDHNISACPPPNFPEGGKYEPEKAEYYEGQRIKYICNGKSSMFFGDVSTGDYKKVTCTSSGKWSEGTPFCDSPANMHLKYPSVSEIAQLKESFLIDSDINTCFPIPKGTKRFFEYSLEGQMVVNAIKVCWSQGRSTITIKISESWDQTYVEDFGSHMVDCLFDSYPTNHDKTGNITVQISLDQGSSISLCEISVFVKEDIWCRHPPEISVPNGQLEVSHSKAVLHCNEGFKEKDGREVYATCENQTWSYLSLQCVEDKSQKDYTPIVIVIGAVILTLAGLAIFLLRKKKPTTGLFVLFKPGGNYGRLSFLSDNNTTNLVEAKDSTVY
ncbi:unnamed protein product [Larinioides sclopetarius]|uniref:Sushi domain-containing protein n=1 Tax=Larinioides sclopetarius TaxID=280406 RepID=A0AAV2ANC6_9ARAC